MGKDRNCKCCGLVYRANDTDFGTIDWKYCGDCADNKVYGVECDHDTLLNDNDWWGKHGRNDG